MKLCIVTPTHAAAQIGGAQYQIELLIEALAGLRAYDITYLARRVPKNFSSDNYVLQGIESGLGANKIGFLADTRSLYRQLVQIRPDIIYQRVACGYTGIAAHFARSYGAKMLWHVAHENDVTPGSVPGGGNAIRHFLEKRAVEYGIKHATHIVTQTKYQAKLLAQHYQRSADAVVPNFHPEPQEEIDKSGPLTVTWIANLKPWKNPGAFVRLAQSLSDCPDVRFVMAGSAGNVSWKKSEYNALMTQLDNLQNLEYLGPITQDDVNVLLARSHLFVNTSCNEGFANTFIQAWFRQVPVISLYVNPDDVFFSEDIGEYAGTEKRLHSIVANLLRKPEAIESMGSRARDYARRHHSVQNAITIHDLLSSGEDRRDA